jgi:hypothetical protein
MWLGLFLSYEIDSLPAGTAVIGVATAVFLLAAIRDRVRSGAPLLPGTPWRVRRNDRMATISANASEGPPTGARIEL